MNGSWGFISCAVCFDLQICPADSGSALPGQLLHAIDPNRPVVQSWQSPSQQMMPPVENGNAPVASEPFQRAAEIVAAAATEAAAAAASVVVSAASKRIKEQLEGLYSQQGVRGGMASTKAVCSRRCERCCPELARHSHESPVCHHSTILCAAIVMRASHDRDSAGRCSSCICRSQSADTVVRVCPTGTRGLEYGTAACRLGPAAGNTGRQYAVNRDRNCSESDAAHSGTFPALAGASRGRHSKSARACCSCACLCIRCHAKRRKQCIRAPTCKQPLHSFRACIV